MEGILAVPHNYQDILNKQLHDVVIFTLYWPFFLC